MKEEFPGWFGSQICQRYIDKDPGVSVSGELFALACGPTSSPISVNSCVVNGVRFVVHSRDERRTTQNNGICSPGEKDGEMYYGQLEEILEFLYMSFKVVLFRVVQDMNHKKFSNGGVIVVEDDHDVIHFNNSSDLTLSTSLNDLDFATLNIDGQSMDVDAPPDIIDVDEEDDFIDDEDVLPHDLADFDDEDLANDDVTMSTAVARGHVGDGGGDDPSHPPLRLIHTGCRGTGGQKPNKGGRRAGRLGTRVETKNLELRKLTNEWGPDFLMYYPSWYKIKEEKKARVLGKLMASNPDLSRTSSRKSGISILTIGLTLSKLPEAFKMLKTRQRARLFCGGISEHLLYSRYEILAMFERARSALGTSGVVGLWAPKQGHGTSNFYSEPRCTHYTYDVDEVKEDNKQLRKELAMLRTVIRSDDRMSQLLMQLESHHEVGGGIESRGGGDDEPGMDEDVDGDEES
ncbi:hypothetical protein Tco_1279698 [Tanacetum coccineum]